MENIKVLVVDDESRMRKLVKDFLTREGYAVLEAGDGMEAMDIFYEDKEIALVILDVILDKVLAPGSPAAGDGFLYVPCPVSQRRDVPTTGGPNRHPFRCDAVRSSGTRPPDRTSHVLADQGHVCGAKRCL